MGMGSVRSTAQHLQRSQWTSEPGGKAAEEIGRVTESTKMGLSCCYLRFAEKTDDHEEDPKEQMNDVVHD
jgi:hypothetical protein